MSQYVIIHGELVKLDDDSLMHWKYIKKERVNGKWRYYYDLGRKVGSNESLVKGYSKLQDWAGLDERDHSNQQNKLYDDAVSNYNKFQKEFEPGVDDPSFATELFEKVTAQGKAAMKAKAAFMKTPLGRLTKASSVVSKALNKLGSKLKSLFKK